MFNYNNNFCFLKLRVDSNNVMLLILIPIDCLEVFDVFVKCVPVKMWALLYTDYLYVSHMIEVYQAAILTRLF